MATKTRSRSAAAPALQPVSRPGVINRLADAGVVISAPKGMPARKVEALITETVEEFTRRSEASDERLEGEGLPKPGRGRLPDVVQKDLDQIIDDASLLSSTEIAERLKTTRMTINRWREEGKLIGFEMARRGFRYPPEQVGPRRVPLAGIPEVLEAFDGDHWAAWQFLSAELPEFGGMTGFKTLANGKLEDLLAVIRARDYGAFT